MDIKMQGKQTRIMRAKKNKENQKEKLGQEVGKDENEEAVWK